MISDERERKKRALSFHTIKGICFSSIMKKREETKQKNTPELCDKSNKDADNLKGTVEDDGHSS